jgi:hypothetical protein
MRIKLNKRIEPHIIKVIPNHLVKLDKNGNKRFKKRGNVYVETIKFNVRIGSGIGSVNTSITLRKNIVSLWILLMDKSNSDPYITVQNFIDLVCMKRWTGNTGKGLSDFITKCMVHSFLDEDDFKLYKKIYLSM